MIHHIVMWKLIDPQNGASKWDLAAEMKNRLMALKNEIEVIDYMEVGINEIHFDKNHDIVLVSRFKNYDDLALYASHPAHLKVVDFVKPITHSRAAVDYEV